MLRETIFVGPNSDQEDGSRPGQVSTGNSSGRRPSLLTARRPPNSRVHTPPLASPSIAPPDLLEDGGASSTPKRLLHGEYIRKYIILSTTFYSLSSSSILLIDDLCILYYK